MKAFGLGLGTMLLRYYLMMLVIVVAGFTGQWWLSVFALPIFLSTILGVQFGKKEKVEGRVSTLKKSTANVEKKVG